MHSLTGPYSICHSITWLVELRITLSVSLTIYIGGLYRRRIVKQLQQITTLPTRQTQTTVYLRGVISVRPLVCRDNGSPFALLYYSSQFACFHKYQGPFHAELDHRFLQINAKQKQAKTIANIFRVHQYRCQQ